ncbi:MAG: T9SS type A sorting domain-containing protein [Bacteroidetes bacterium]|nr:T9SS type A sorting domain-containing protein [Bacteroidota bacterium]
MKNFLLVLLLALGTTAANAQAPGSGYAIDCNVSTDYVSIPNHAALNPTTALTLEAWIKADSWSPNSWGNVIISKDGWGSGEAGYTLRCGANGTLSFMFGTTTSWKEAVSTPQMALNTWTHVAGTYDGTRLTVYINGVASGTFLFSGPMLPSTYNLAIGRITYTAGGTRNFDGKIDEVRVWSTALSAATIQQYMTKKINPAHPNYANLAGYWKMDEGTGLSTADSGPNGLTGTRNGTTWAVSGAAIGDDNTVIYGSPTSATVTNLDGSAFTAQINSGNPTALHVYAVHQTPNSTNENLTGSLETTHYFGTFLVGGTNPSYTATYAYTGVAGLAASTQEENIRLAYRTDNEGILWSRLGNQFHVDTLANTVYRCGILGRREFAAGFDSLRFAMSQSTICQGDTLSYFGQQLTSAGTYSHVTTGPNGCDSISGIQLTVTPTVFGSDSATICSGDSVVFGNQILQTTGVFTETFQAQSGCDSTVTFSLTVNPPMTMSISDTICDGDIYTLGSQSLTQPGTYSETFSAIDGCDSVVVLSLGIHLVDTSVTVNGNTLTANLNSPSYQWLACDNGFGVIPGQTGQSFTVGSDGNYAVIVSDGICSDTSGCHFVLAVGVTNGMDAILEVYPNPSSGIVHLRRTDLQAIGQVELMTVDGRVVVIQQETDASAMDLDLGALPVGLYFLRLELNGRLVALKLAKE